MVCQAQRSWVGLCSLSVTVGQRRGDNDPYFNSEANGRHPEGPEEVTGSISNPVNPINPVKTFTAWDIHDDDTLVWRALFEELLIQSQPMTPNHALQL